MGLTLGSEAAQTAAFRSKVPTIDVSHMFLFFLIKKFPLNIDYWILILTRSLCSFEAKELPKLPLIQSKTRKRNPDCMLFYITLNQNKSLLFTTLHKLQPPSLFILIRSDPLLSPLCVSLDPPWKNELFLPLSSHSALYMHLVPYLALSIKALVHVSLSR